MWAHVHREEGVHSTHAIHRRMKTLVIHTKNINKAHTPPRIPKQKRGAGMCKVRTPHIWAVLIKRAN